MGFKSFFSKNFNSNNDRKIWVDTLSKIINPPPSSAVLLEIVPADNLPALPSLHRSWRKQGKYGSLDSENARGR